MYLKYAAVALTAVLPFCNAQTSTKCNPTEKKCPDDDGIGSYTFESDFTQGDSALDGWTTTSGDVKFDDNGAGFVLAKQGDAPTIETSDYFLFGNVEVTMKAAPGTGVVSSIVMESDDLDEIDWEGVGGNPNQIQTNYFGKGDTTTYDRETWENVDAPQDDFHTYTVDWTKDTISWIVDGKTLRTVKYADAKGGSRFPQTPMRLRLGIWAGGDPSNGEGTIQWAGGRTDYSQAPFSMYVQSVKITNYTPADTYKFTDTSGSYQSIKASNSTSHHDDDSSSTTTGSSSSSTSTDASTTSDSSSPTSTSSSGDSGSSGSSGSGSSDSGSSDSGSSDSGSSDSGSGSSSSGSGSPSASGSSAGSSAAPTAFEGAATSLATSYTAPAMMLALFTAMLQL